MGYSCLVTDNCICNDIDDRVQNGDCNHHYYNKLKDAIMPTDQWERNWNWDLELDEWLECTQETENVWECGGSSYQPWPWSLTEGGRILTKSCCPELLRKTRCWQTDCSGIQRRLIRYWKFLLVSEDLSGPDCTLKPLQSAPFQGLRHSL